MIQTAPEIRRTHKRASVKQISLPAEGWIAWMPLHGNTYQFETTLHTWIERNNAKINESGFLQGPILSKWKTLLSQYIPPFPAKGLVITQEKDRTEIIPIRCKISSWGLEPTHTGWETLWAEIKYEPTLRIIELTRIGFKLYEIREHKAELCIDLPIQEEPRYQAIRKFIASALRLYRKDPGPFIVSGIGDGIMELDCWVLSGYFPIQACRRTYDGINTTHWWRDTIRQGYGSEWTNKWASAYIERSKKEGKWVADEMNIQVAVRQNRLEAILEPSSSSAFILTCDKIKQIVKNHIPVFKVDVDFISGVTKINQVNVTK